MGLMMEKERTRSTPYILIDEDKGYMRFEGKSFHEEVADFYSDVTKWLDTYLTTDFGTFTFDCMLEYFNSSTTKFLLNLLKDMDNVSGDGKTVIVNWTVDKDNDVIIECVEDFQEELQNIEIQLIYN